MDERPLTFGRMIEEAQQLSDADLKRHAQVSTRNNHKCRECFTCACEYVRQSRTKDKA